MLISSLAISGIFPFAGFWSKDEILMTAFHENLPLWIIGSVASIMTAFYMFRLMYLTFFKEFRGTEHQKNHLHESPLLITIPLIVLAILATFGGLINFPGNNWLNHYLQPIISKVSHEEALNSTSYILMGIALVGAIVGITIAYMKYIKKSAVPAEDENITGISKIIYNKYYVDEAYALMIVNPLNAASRFFRDTFETGLSNIVFGFGKVTDAIGTQGRKIQSGSIGLYLFAFVLGVCVILTCLFIAQ
jgi:NADH-quinone oxidoreductase subunit L